MNLFFNECTPRSESCEVPCSALWLEGVWTDVKPAVSWPYKCWCWILRYSKQCQVQQVWWDQFLNRTMLSKSNFGVVFLFTPSELLSCASTLRFHLAGFFLRFTARRLDELFRSLVQVGIRHTGLGTLFHGFMSSLVFQPFRTLQSKISKRFEVFFFHTPCSKSHHAHLQAGPGGSGLGYVFWIRKRHLGGFCGCLTTIFKRNTTAAWTKGSQASWQPLRFRPTLRLRSADATVATSPTIRACSSGSHQRQDTEPCEGYPRGSSTRTRSSA